ERRSAGCQNPGAAGANRSAVAGSGEASQSPGTGRPDLSRARASLVQARTSLVNVARGLTKSYGERIRGCNPRNMDTEKAEALSPELQVALGPLLQALESLNERI